MRMTLRFMKLISTGEERYWRWWRRSATRRQASPKQIECRFDPGMQARVAVKRPDQKRAEYGLAKYMSDLRGRQVVADFAAILAKLNHLSMQGMDASLQVHHRLANRSRRKIGLQKRANDGGVARGLLRHADAEGAEELRH